MFSAEHFYDPDLHFDEESHTYIYKGRELKSVTTLISEYKQPFEKEEAAKREVENINSHEHNEEWTKEDVLNMWDAMKEDACEIGNRIHRYAENLFGSPREIGKNWNEHCEIFREVPGMCKSVDRFFINMKGQVVPLGEWRPTPEVQICHPDHNLAGTVDLLYSLGNAPAILDWKTNKSIEVFGYDKMLSPLDDLDDCNYNHYALQLNLYRWILRERYEYDVEDRMKMVHLKGDGSYEEYEVPVMEDAVESMVGVSP